MFLLSSARASGKTILLTESGSDLEYVINSGLIDKVILLEKGRVVAEGMPYEILSREDLLERCGIEPPGVTKLFFELKKRFSDIKTIPVTVEEALKIMESWKFKLPEKICPPPRFKLYKDRETIVLAKNVEFIYPSGVKALSGVDLEVREGSVVAIVGQNGSGKTTLAKILVGLYKPSNPGAKVIVDGIDLRNAPLDEVIKRINYVFQNPADQLFCDTVIEELTYGPRMLGMSEDWIKDRLNKIVKLFNLEDRLDSYIMSLTQGEKRLVAVASIAMLKPKVMIVDEVTGGLDMPDARKLLGALMRLNSEEGLTLMMITHDMRIAAEYSDQVVVMSNGRVVSAGTPREVFGKEIDMLKELSLMPPQITLLAYELSKRHREIPRDILSVDEFIEYIEDVR
jgi:energy-coupling factor transport system ATP-binding protein